MTTTDDPEEFREKWHSYVKELQRLRLSLPPDIDPRDEFDDAVEALHDLVDVAADHQEAGDDG